MIKQVAFEEIYPIYLKTNASGESQMISVLEIKDFTSLSDCINYKIFSAEEWDEADFKNSDCIYIIEEGVLRKVNQYNENYNDYYKINSLSVKDGVLIQGTNIEYSSINFYLINVKNENGNIIEIIDPDKKEGDDEFDLSNCISKVTFPEEDDGEENIDPINFTFNTIAETSDAISEDDYDTTEQDDFILKNDPNATSIEIDEEDLESKIQVLPPNNPYVIDLMTDNFEELVKGIEILMPDFLEDYQTENWLDENIDSEEIIEQVQERSTVGVSAELYGIKMNGYFTYHDGEDGIGTDEDEDDILETDEDPV